MRDFLVFGGLPAFVVTLGALWIVVPRVKRIPRPWPRRIAGGFTLAAGVLAMAPLAFASFAQVEQGTWLCLVCGRSEEQTRYLGAVVFSRPLETPEFGWARHHPEWFQTAVALEHDHDWMPVGCHLLGNGTTRYLSDAGLRRLHECFSVVPDKVLAEELVMRFARANGEQRRLMLADMSPWDASPFAAPFEDEKPSPEGFRASYAAWTEEHPLWR